MQKLIKDSKGTVRFQSNEIVYRLLTHCRMNGFNLKQLAREKFSQADWEQFYQLIGYSLCGYHELDCVSDESALAATRLARESFPSAAGC